MFGLRSVGATLGVLAWLFAWEQIAAGQDLQEIAEMDLAELAQVEIATGISVPISEAPAVATVITADEIAAMGATDLDQVLETVPGLHLVPSPIRRFDPIHSLRGIHSENGSRILFLLDGVPITQAFGSGQIFNLRLPVHHIARIELIRGPGSAVYGADAFAGVVNVITKTGEEIGGTEVGVLAGSFGTRNVWLQHGGRLGSWDFSVAADWFETDGDDDRIIRRDGQTTIDEILGTSASRAPGPIETHGEYKHLHLGLTHDRWALRFWGWEGVAGLGVGFGNQVLDPEGSEEDLQYLFDVEFTDRDSYESWELSARSSWLYFDQVADVRIAPPGAVLPIAEDGNINFTEPRGFVLFPEGVTSRPGNVERVGTLEGASVYSGFANHRLRFGVGLRQHDVDTRSVQNFGPGVIDGSQPVVDGTLTDVTDTPFVFIPDRNRDQWFVLVQDEWKLAEGWQLTLGARYDEYSDVGGTLNPRFALVWAPALKPFRTKLLYGSAYLAPSFAQTSSINNPVNLGNPNLNPETIDTLELVFDYRGEEWDTVVNLFSYRADDIVVLLPDAGSNSRTYQNANRQEGHGFEIETSWTHREGHLEVAGSFAWQDSKDRVTEAPIADAPGQKIFLSGRWRPLASWSAYAEVIHVRDRNRAPGDARPEVEDYTVVDAALRFESPSGGWGASLGLRNLFDEEAVEPAPPAVVDDYPVAGRSLLVELRYRF